MTLTEELTPCRYVYRFYDVVLLLFKKSGDQNPPILS